MMFGKLGPMELILILVIALVVFGPSKLPDIGKSVGKAIRGFKDEANKLKEDVDISEDLKMDESPKK